MKTISTLLLVVTVVTAQAQMWGVTSAGGAQASGAIYKTAADGTGFAITAEFECDPGGALPEGGHLIKYSNGKLYGTTFTGGANGNGVIFEYDLPITDQEFFDPEPNLSIGFEIVTSSHAFQVFVGNYKSLVPQYNHAMNNNSFGDNQILIGFNLTRLWNF